jgi:hypothetical protein
MKKQYEHLVFFKNGRVQSLKFAVTYSRMIAVVEVYNMQGEAWNGNSLSKPKLAMQEAIS